MHQAFLGTLLGNIFIAFGIFAFVFLLHPLKNKIIYRLDYVTAVTVGLMLGIIFLGFLPEIIHESNGNETMLGALILVGLGVFYILELFFHWHHCKDLDINCHTHDHHHTHTIEDTHKHEHKNGYLMFSGTFLHNIFHGIELFSAFAINTKLGIGMTLAIFLHAIPQNIAHFAINHKNIKYVYIASIGGVLGALLTYPFSDFLLAYTHQILAIIMGGLIYISLTDIFPSFKEKGTTTHKLYYLLFMIFGIILYISFSHLIDIAGFGH